VSEIRGYFPVSFHLLPLSEQFLRLPFCSCSLSRIFSVKGGNYVQNHFEEKAGRDLAIMQLREKREKFLMVT
jgi:hypothetical protein